MISIYKPNKANTGVAFTFQIGEGGRGKDKEYALYCMQSNSILGMQKRVGSFRKQKRPK